MTDWGVVHDACVDALAALARDLDEAALATMVAATPEWSVHDVLAHQAGGSTDAVTGRMDGAPSTAWTSRHVAERARVPVAELIAELRATQAALTEAVRDQAAPAIVWDRAVHLADLHEALNREAPDRATWAAIVEAMRPRLAAAVPLDDACDYELFRAAFSRRSQRQLAALFPRATPEQLARVGFFGPREDDQPIP